ncbi:MAG: N-acetylmuramoyl-L-alanine amidase, partial [Pseudomonadales bacterium]|nr:N-acetylmuramoyl-L-alanine amidase [Pseudomonadales bacterium]
MAITSMCDAAISRYSGAMGQKDTISVRTLVCALILGCWLPGLALSTDTEISIIGRDAWHARPPRDDSSTWAEYDRKRPPDTRIVLHVTSMGRGYGEIEMKRIQDFHMDERGFSDIGYNYLIDSDGNIFEGRSLDYVPAHAGRTLEADEGHDITLDPDYGSIGIVFSADTNETLTVSQTDSAVALIDWLEARHPITSVITHTEVRRTIEARGLTPRRDFD